ncbi:filamin-A-like, partial [Oncorhynchus keta]|uniref:filamin-A-like n=1 Tax=Oncorhynchus keta TaxID=8018 RepID=UPI00227D6478
SKAIVDGNLKLILGMVWTLILHYSISMPMWDEEEKGATGQHKTRNRGFRMDPEQAPRDLHPQLQQRLAEWQSTGALVKQLCSGESQGLCEGRPVCRLEPVGQTKPVDNAREAMKQADNWLGIPQVITPEEIVDPNVDEHSVMTYLSQFPKSKLKPGAPLCPGLNPKNACAYGPGDSSKATAQGPGLEPAGNIANKTTYFDVYTAGAGVGEVEVVIMDPAGKKDVVVSQIEDKGNSSYRCTYKPTLEGAHTIYVTFAGGQISKSPFTVNIGEACNPSLVRAKGRGLQPKGLRVKETADFRVFTKGAGTGELKVTIKGPSNTQNTSPSPLEVKIGSEAGPQNVRAWGPGLETGIMGKSADFVVEAVGDNVGTLGFSVEGPSQAKVECDDKGDGSCDVRYWPMEAGEYAVHVLCNNEDIQHSPFMAEITAALNKDYYPDK